jgi:hypothetical protein
VGDSFFEYGGVAPERFGLWEDVLQDVKPEQDPRRARQAIEQLWPHLEALKRLVDASSSHTAVYLESIQRSIESARADQKNRRHGDVSLDLFQAVESIERLLLGLIGPAGQSPVAPRSVEIPLTPLFESWMFLATGCANLVPNPASKQTIQWQQTRAFLRPAQVKALAVAEVRDVAVDDCRAQIEAWNDTEAVKRGLASIEDDRRTYGAVNARFREVLSGFQADLKAYASRGEGYIGWTAWYGYE